MMRVMVYILAVIGGVVVLKFAFQVVVALTALVVLGLSGYSQQIQSGQITGEIT